MSISNENKKNRDKEVNFSKAKDTSFVDQFTDPLEALSIFEHNPNNYDLVLSDIRMPGITVLELVRKIKEINPRINCALISAFDTDSFHSEMKELGLSTFMKKPCILSS